MLFLFWVGAPEALLELPSGLSFRRPCCGLKLEGDGDLGFTAFTLG